MAIVCFRRGRLGRSTIPAAPLVRTIFLEDATAPLEIGAPIDDGITYADRAVLRARLYVVLKLADAGLAQ